MYNSSTGGPGAGSGGGANWNSWGLTNSGSAGSSEYCRFTFLSGFPPSTVTGTKSLNFPPLNFQMTCTTVSRAQDQLQALELCNHHQVPTPETPSHRQTTPQPTVDTVSCLERFIRTSLTPPTHQPTSSPIQTLSSSGRRPTQAKVTNSSSVKP
jgi:hypothetical protein